MKSVLSVTMESTTESTVEISDIPQEHIDALLQRMTIENGALSSEHPDFGKFSLRVANLETNTFEKIDQWEPPHIKDELQAQLWGQASVSEAFPKALVPHDNKYALIIHPEKQLNRIFGSTEDVLNLTEPENETTRYCLNEDCLSAIVRNQYGESFYLREEDGVAREQGFRSNIPPSNPHDIVVRAQVFVPEHNVYTHDGKELANVMPLKPYNPGEELTIIVMLKRTSVEQGITTIPIPLIHQELREGTQLLTGVNTIDNSICEYEPVFEKEQVVEAIPVAAFQLQILKAEAIRRMRDIEQDELESTLGWQVRNALSKIGFCKAS